MNYVFQLTITFAELDSWTPGAFLSFSTSFSEHCIVNWNLNSSSPSTIWRSSKGSLRASRICSYNSGCCCCTKSTSTVLYLLLAAWRSFRATLRTRWLHCGKRLDDKQSILFLFTSAKCSFKWRIAYKSCSGLLVYWIIISHIRAHLF